MEVHMEPAKRTQYIVFTADVQAVQAGKLRVAITEAVNNAFDEIYLLISSGGGNVFEGLGLAAFIKTLPIPVITHNISQIDSVAGVIFAAGTKRLANTNSSFLFHGVTNYINQTLNETQLKEVYDQTKRLRERPSLRNLVPTAVLILERSISS